MSYLVSYNNMYTLFIIYLIFLYNVCLGSAVVSIVCVVYSHSCVRGSNPSQGKPIIGYALNKYIISDASSAELVDWRQPGNILVQ